ncbi:phosphotransferase family protein [Novosphingobium rosa]|uniref:phosphotransferase family protein n=1 Tax=Novosphingobium rosa TaxID=76978 RepID=UPI00082CE8D5|nr:phosphotransferase family protein [Novosphingobium rosa]
MADITTPQLTDYLTNRLPEWHDLTVAGLHRLPMGASRETYRCDLSYTDEHGARQELPVILRRDPPASNVDSDRAHEFAAYRAIYGHGIPVPRMLLLEEDPEPLGGAISLAEDLRGFHNSEYQFQKPEWAPLLPHIAREMWGTMGRLAAVPVEDLDLSFTRPATREGTAAAELAYWVASLDKHDIGAEPIIRAAIRKLERWQPVAQKLALVHGDFRAGNFLYDDAGNLKAVLDWEMAHCGDPLEDLAWSLTRTFCFGKDDLRSGLAPREEAIRIWEEASGLTADPKALWWWELFICVKAQAIWNAAAHVWQTGAGREIIHAYAAWWLRNAQDKAALELMEVL